MEDLKQTMDLGPNKVIFDKDMLRKYEAQCPGCTSSVQQSNVHGGVNALLVTGRKAEWAGPTQELELDTLLGVRTASLSYAINLVKESSFQHGWVFKITTNGVIKYETIADETVTSGDGWKIIEKEVQIPDTTGAESVKVYLKGSPVGAEFLLDDVSLVDTTGTERVIRPNILFISVDDLRPNLDIYKDGKSFLSPQIHSPNLNKLAENSIVFDNAYCQYAICGYVDRTQQEL